jgi:hypothetical protein
MNKKIIPFLVATGLLLGSFGIAAAYTAFLSGQVGTSPTNGFVLQTNGSVSTWVATSSLGISGGSSASTTLLTDNNTFSGINSFTNALSNWAGTWAGHAVSYFQVAGNYLTANAIATSTGETAGNLAYWTSTNGTPALLGKVATTTANCSGTASCSQFTVIGSSPVTITGAGTSASTTLLTDNNTFSGTNVFSNAASTFAGTWQTYSPSHFFVLSDWFATTTIPQITTAANLATVGTITSGVWHGTAIGDSYISSATNWNTAYNNRISSVVYPLSFSSNILSIGTSSATTAGVLSAADWTTFNNKGSGTVTSVGAVYPLSSTGSATPVISSATSSGTSAGVLSAADWTTFNNKQATVSATYPILFSANTISTAISTSTITNLPNLVQTGTITSGTWNGTAIGDSYISSASTWNGKQANLSLLAGSYTNGDVCTYASSGTLLNCNTALPTGTVTSVGLSDANSTLTIGGTPVTTSGTLTATLNLAHANAWTGLATFNNSTSTLFSAGTIWDTGLGAGFVQSSATGLLSSAALTSAQITTACPTCLTAAPTITLTGAVTGSGTGSFATTYAGTLGNTLGGTGQDSHLWNGLAAVNAGVWSALSTTSMKASITGSAGSVANSLSNDGATLTGSSFNGSSAVSNWAINLAHGNTWSALQQFGNATSTLLSAGTIWDTGLGAGAVQSSGTGLLSSGTLTIANGGTGATTCGTSGGVWYYNGSIFVCAANMTYNGATGQLLTVTNASTTNLTAGTYFNSPNLYSNATTTIQSVNGQDLGNGTHGIRVYPGTSTTTIQFY